MTPAVRLIWVPTYERTRNAWLTCRRYQSEGEAGLLDRSRRPRCSPAGMVGEAEEERIISLRRSGMLGNKRLRNELIRLDGLHFSLDTIHKVLRRHGLNRLKPPRLIRSTGGKCYARPIPGDRTQMDICRIAPNLYSYTAIDDGSRYQVVAALPRKSAAATLAFLDQVVEEMPFSNQRVQIDRGQEFFACKVQERLRDWRIKFRPIRPRSPHLNGKSETISADHTLEATGVLRVARAATDLFPAAQTDVRRKESDDGAVQLAICQDTLGQQGVRRRPAPLDLRIGD